MLAAAGPVEAAIPQSTIQGWQDSATEAIEITVLSVDESKRANPVAGVPGCVRTYTTLTVTAEIKVARRSASGLAPGNVIVFDDEVLSVWPCVIVDGNIGQPLNPGDRTVVYLRPAESLRQGPSRISRVPCKRCYTDVTTQASANASGSRRDGRFGCEWSHPNQKENRNVAHAIFALTATAVLSTSAAVPASAATQFGRLAFTKFSSV
jgi:hypothetical protein